MQGWILRLHFPKSRDELFGLRIPAKKKKIDFGSETKRGHEAIVCLSFLSIRKLN
jgi:hypothetical protein